MNEQDEVRPPGRLTVVDLRAGAVYQDTVYDQDVVVRTELGEVVLLFDMAPMIGTGLQPGEFIQALAVVTEPTNVRRAGPNDTSAWTVEAAAYVVRNEEWDRYRPELRRHPWILLMGAGLAALLETVGVGSGSGGELVVGDRVVWDSGRLDLAAWRRSPQPL
jgi:hypothetical protein